MCINPVPKAGCHLEESKNSKGCVMCPKEVCPIVVVDKIPVGTDPSSLGTTIDPIVTVDSVPASPVLTAMNPSDGDCWANGAENEKFCETSNFTFVSCVAPRCHWGPKRGVDTATDAADGATTIE